MARSKLTWFVLLLACLFIILAFTMLTARAATPYADNNVENLRQEIVILKTELQDLREQISTLTARQATDNSALASLLALLDNRADALELELDYWKDNIVALLENRMIEFVNQDLTLRSKVDSLTAAVVDLKAKQRAMNEESHAMENRLRDEAQQNSDRLNSAFADMVKKLKAENENLVAQAQQWTLIAIGVAVGIPVLWLLKKKGKLRFKFRIPFSTPGSTDVPEPDRVECAKNLLLSKGIPVGEAKPPKKRTKELLDNLAKETEVSPRPTGNKRARK